MSVRERLLSQSVSLLVSVDHESLPLMACEYCSLFSHSLIPFDPTNCQQIGTKPNRIPSSHHPTRDEPAIRAKFDLTLVAPKDRVALSNMPLIEETEDPTDSSQKVLKFATTPSMSTYLLCYVIGEYDHVEQRSAKGIPVRVYTPLGKTEQGQFALDVAVRCLDFYEEYFKIAYPLPKLDLIAISDFLIGAMENWGLITYRETCILFDPQNSSTSAKEFIAIVVCHEVSHQWVSLTIRFEFLKL